MPNTLKAIGEGLLLGAVMFVAPWTIPFLSPLIYAAEINVLTSALQDITSKGKTGETRGMQVSVTDSTADARVIYGEVRTGGVNIIPPYTSGTNGQYLHQILALAMHECDSVQAVYFDQDTVGSLTSITGTANDGKVTTGKYANRAWVRNYLGTMSQTVDYILNTAFPTQWASTARGRGCAYTALQFDWGDGKLYTRVPTVTLLVRGAKCYDPRLDSTNGGSGSHRYATPSTWAWTANPALCWANYKISAYGFGCDPATDIDWASVTAAANVCDAAVQNKDGSTEPRYTCNGILLNSTNSLRPNERKLIDSMFGKMTFVNGIWSIYAGSWAAPDFSIAQTDWLGISSIQTVAPRDGGRFNQVHCFYVDPNRNWQRVECYPRKNATFKSADGAEAIDLEMEQPMCRGESEAQRKGEFMLRLSRNGVKLAGTLPPRFQKLRTYGTVSVTFASLGWSSKTFRIYAMSLNPDGSVQVTLVEEQSTDWTDLLTAEYGNPSAATIPATNPTTPSAPQNFAVAIQAGSIQCMWDEPVVKPNGTRYRIIASPNSGDASVGTIAWEGDSRNVYVPWNITNSNYYWYAQTICNTYTGGYSPNTYGILALPGVSPNVARFPIVDPYFGMGKTVSSYWVTDDGAGGSYGLFRQPGENAGIYPGAGAFEMVCSTGIWSMTLRPTRTAIPGEMQYVSSYYNGVGRFGVTPGQWINAYVTMRRLTSMGGANPQFNLKFYAVDSGGGTTQIYTQTMLVPATTPWFTYTGSVQFAPNSSGYASVYGVLSSDFANTTSGTVQIGRFDITIR